MVLDRPRSRPHSLFRIPCDVFLFRTYPSSPIADFTNSMAAWHQMQMFLKRHETHTGDKRQDVLANFLGIQFAFCLPFRRPCGWSSACPQRSWAAESFAWSEQKGFRGTAS
jgi:hypothetical protein